MFNPINASKEIMKYYLRYIETAFYINDNEYFDMFRSKLRDESYFSKGPYLDATDSFKAGKSLSKLIDEGEVSSLFRNLNQKAMPVTRPLYLHQERSIRCINKGDNAVITTGTGSGKTESFILPILNYLFREKEQGKLGSGVRALLVYPMNALANDQIKRLRELLKDTPDITFGAYTGETEHRADKAYNKFVKLNHCEPLPNELISRDAIKENPPHFLITNYAMLEYLMIRPDDNVLFSGEYGRSWKFIVFDEAHTYTGATGIEVSMLIKRLKARLETNNEIQYILTSATLGSSESDNGEVIHFANTICSVDNFKNENIIRASRVKISQPDAVCSFPDSMYKLLWECVQSYNSNDILYDKAVKYFSTLEKGENIEETVFNLLSKDGAYYKLKGLLDNTTVSVYDAMHDMNMTAETIVAFISLASKGRKNGAALFDARYHYFIRTLEGAYLSLAPNKNLFIEPRKTYLDSKVFKFSVCKSCGEIYIEGYTFKKANSNISYFSSDMPDIEANEKTPKVEYYLLNGEKLAEDEKNSYTLCGKCGAIAHRYDMKKKEKMCSCGEAYHHNIVKVPNENIKTFLMGGKRLVRKCMCCEAVARNNSVLRDFYMGQAAAASVIGTSLYGQLPSKKMIIHTIPQKEAEEDIFGFSTVQTKNLQHTEIEKLTKQYLIFSDSRQEAAYFASYFDTTYHNLLRRRILVEVLKERSAEYRGGVSVSVICRHLEVAFSKYNVFEADRRKEEALKTFLYEMVSNERNSLEGLGLISFCYKHNDMDLPVFQNGETKAVINVLADSFRKKVAIKYENIADLSDEDKEFFQYSAVNQTIALSKENQEIRTASRDTWTAPTHKNLRTDYLSRLSHKIHETAWDNNKINEFLKLLWIKVFMDNGSIISDDNIGYRMLIDHFIVYSAFSEEIPKFVCSKCGKITMNNASGICPEFRCDGVLKPFDVDSLKNNHYYRVYTELDIYDLIIKEHTAQLDLETAKQYQDKFVNKEINVLSCSTTFEMGVDVGDLETVFMKNMPPTPANYIQRAGRAGRRTDSAAYALTFCRLSSHDLNFYRTPEKMIRGHILPPSFEVTNEKIVRRHVNACCFAAFFRLYPMSFSDVETFFMGKYYDLFVRFIRSRDEMLLNNLYDSVPQQMHKHINEWLDNLVSENGELRMVYEQTVEDINQLEESLRELVDNDTAACYHGAANIRNAIRTIKEINILTFLSRKSILPKYGFPVDSVELQTNPSGYGYNNSSKLRLSRDLAIAIAEYAPDCEIIADGKIYTSRYVKLPPNKKHTLLTYQYSVCKNPECGCINTSMKTGDNKGSCKICNSEVKSEGTFVIPEYGFVSELKAQKATTRKPERTYRGDVHYIGNSSGTTEMFEIGDTSVSVTKTIDDELLVLNNTAFYICPVCGFAFREKKGLREDKKVTDKSHKKQNGHICSGTIFNRQYLGHKLKTDVAIINISQPIEREQALSVLYALLEGISSYYSIERSDISGCLHCTYENRKLHTTFVIYDTVPGGAGHAARIANGGKSAMIGIFKEAYRVVNECTCGGENGDGACYSCLCNYENQKNHDKLNRGKAKDYIERILKNS
ncbi:MAG: DEAD/DEAH box helicase [Ruminococcus sp.]|nr:DEAD/DEAH box helicase [Ruminococcus sp.]